MIYLSIDKEAKTEEHLECRETAWDMAQLRIHQRLYGYTNVMIKNDLTLILQDNVLNRKDRAKFEELSALGLCISTQRVDFLLKFCSDFSI